MKNNTLHSAPKKSFTSFMRPACGFIVSIGISMASPLHASTRNWNVAGGGEFTTSANWNAAFVPGSADIANFGNNATGTITFANDITVTELTFNNTAGSLLLDLTGRRLASSAWIRIGQNATPNTVTFQGGKVDFQRLYFSGSGNALTINGSEFKNDGTQYLRVTGSGNTLLITNGGSLTMISGSQESYIGADTNTVNQGGNAIIVSGLGSKLQLYSEFSVGRSTSSESSHGNLLRIEAGATGSNTGILNIGHRASTNNRLEIHGAGSSFVNTGNLWIGGSRTQEANTANTAKVEAGGTLEVQGSIYVGGASTGSSSNRLEIDNGAVTATNTIYIGYASANNVIDVQNGGSLSSTGDIQIGRATTASSNNTLTVGTNATAQTAATLSVSRGKLEIKGGHVSADTLSIVSGDAATASIDFSTGILAANSASVTKTGALVIGDGISPGAATYRLTSQAGTHTIANGINLASNGRIEGAGTLNSSVTTTAGASVSVGDGADFGILNINSHWNNTGVSLTLGIGDLTGGIATAGDNFDQLLFGNGFTFTAGGNVVLDLAHFQVSLATPPEEFRVLGWSAYAGSLDDIAVSFTHDPSYLSYRFDVDGLYVSVVPEPSGLLLLLGAAGFFVLRRYVKRKA